MANNLVFEEDLEKFEKEEHARYLEEERFYKENNTSEAEEFEKYFKEHPDEARGKKTIEVNQTEGQKNRADKAVREGTHKHVGFTNLVKDIKKNNKSLTDESANKIAGYIQSKSKKKFGSKTVSKGGRKHVEPAI